MVIKEKKISRYSARLKFDSDCKEIVSDARVRAIVQAKNERIADNTSKLLEYIDSVRSTYSGELLAFIEETVIKKWASIKYRRAANLAHFDVERAITCFSFKKMVSDSLASWEENSGFDEEQLARFNGFQDYAWTVLFKEWEKNDFKIPIEEAKEKLEKAFYSKIH